MVFAILAKLFGKSEKPAPDQATLSRFRQLRERNGSEEPVEGKKDLLVRMRGMELQTASTIRSQPAHVAEEAARTAANSAEASDGYDRDLTGRKGF